jgi:hypothetical protein
MRSYDATTVETCETSGSGTVWRGYGFLPSLILILSAASLSSIPRDSVFAGNPALVSSVANRSAAAPKSAFRASPNSTVMLVINENANHPSDGFRTHPASINTAARSWANDIHSWSSGYVVISKACGENCLNALDICARISGAIDRYASRALSSIRDFSASACFPWAVANSVCRVNNCAAWRLLTDLPLSSATTPKRTTPIWLSQYTSTKKKLSLNSYMLAACMRGRCCASRSSLSSR